MKIWADPMGVYTMQIWADPLGLYTMQIWADGLCVSIVPYSLRCCHTMVFSRTYAIINGYVGVCYTCLVHVMHK